MKSSNCRNEKIKIKMGASVSSNIAKVAVNSITKVAAEIVQNTAITTNSSQVISVTDNQGDVTISGNTLRQRATVNMQALFNAMSSEEAQQKLAVEIAQEAKAITSGLNLGQFAASSNILETLISASIDLSSKIGQTCSLSSSQSQSIVVERARGSTTITNNVLDQMTDLLQSCVESAVNNNKAIQDVTAKIKQEASASAVGLSEWALALMGGVMVGVPVIGGVVGGVYALKYIFPIVLIAGIVMIGVYIYSTNNAMSYTAFSSLVENSTNCAPTLLEEEPAATAQAAAAKCLANDRCVAVDFKKYNVAESGAYTALDAPTARYYSSVSCSSVKPDGGSLVRAPVLFVGEGIPSTVAGAVPGDVYVNTETSNWYQMDNARVWHLKYMLIHEEFVGMTVSGRRPEAGNQKPANYYYIYSDPASMAYWHIYKNDGARWIEQLKKPGPGMYTVVPQVSNTTSFKIKERKSWLLYAGIAATVLGIGGTVYTMYKSSNKEEIQ